MEYKLINLSYLEEVADGDKEMIKELVQIFIEQLPEFITDFSVGLEQSDWNKIAGAAHKAKSSVVSMGMKELGDTDLKNLELLAKQCRLNDLKLANSEVEGDINELAKLVKTLNEYPTQRLEWIKEYASADSVEELVIKFKVKSQEAIVELNNAMLNY